MLLVVPVKDTDEALRFINRRDHPLVIYVFSRDKAFQNKGESETSLWTYLWIINLPLLVVLNNTKSGSVVSNDTMIIVGGASSIDTFVYGTTKCVFRSLWPSDGRCWTEWM